MKISELKELRDGESFEVAAVLRSIASRTAKNGREFLVLDFSDNSGSFSAMCFADSAAFDAFKNARPADAFFVRACADFYQGRFSPKLEDARPMEDRELESMRDSLAAVSPCDPEEMRRELFEIIGEISDPALRETVLCAIQSCGDAFFTGTAAVKMHHAYVHGLLEHSLKCARTARALLPLYPFIDADLALAGTVLHDIGKTAEYTQTIAPDKSRTGILQGHVVLGYRMVRRAGLKSGLGADLLERLEHIILSHQGEPEWGAAVRAATPEAVFVSCVDNLDARMGAVEAALSQTGDSEFVEVAALRAKLLTSKPEHSAKEESGGKIPPKKDSQAQ